MQHSVLNTIVLRCLGSYLKSALCLVEVVPFLVSSILVFQMTPVDTMVSKFFAYIKAFKKIVP